MSDYKPRSESRGEGREGREGGSNRRYISRPKFCQFCSDKNLVIDYKNVDMMTRFINETGKIRPRRQTGTCARHQREVATAIKNARHIALVPFEGDLWSENSY
ncbi:MAG: 30S ribosomal protein S18 [Anaerolineaceae bacterium]